MSRGEQVEGKQRIAARREKAVRSDFRLNYHNTKPWTPLNGNMQYFLNIKLIHA